MKIKIKNQIKTKMKQTKKHTYLVGCFIGLQCILDCPAWMNSEYNLNYDYYFMVFCVLFLVNSLD